MDGDKIKMKLELIVEGEDISIGDIASALKTRFKLVDPIFKRYRSLSEPTGLFISNGQPAFYLAQNGDTLSGIGQQFGKSTAQMMQLNPAIKDADLIYEGQYYRVSQ